MNGMPLKDRTGHQTGKELVEETRNGTGREVWKKLSRK